MRLCAPRLRLAYAGLLVLTATLGLATRRFPAAFPGFVAAYAGDALWAASVFWLLAIFFPAARPWRLAASAAGVAVAVELSQLYHAPWIDAMRASPPGALLLGRGFLWSDFLCYAVGVMIAAAIDLLSIRARA